MGVIAKGIPRGCQGLFTPVPLGYPLSVFNKNSTLKRATKKHARFACQGTTKNIHIRFCMCVKQKI